MKKKAFFSILLFLLCGLYGSAQDNRSGLRISVLTCAPGQELYSTFGHTAIRVVDSIQHTDIVYNYGTFDFSDPDFYSKFTRGKLDYFLSIASLPDFMYEYRSENRDVYEQVLALSEQSKKAIQQALNETLSGAARYYKYDFLYNNCTSRVRDIIMRYGGLEADQQLVPSGTSFRDMLHEYLDKGNQAWSKFGIDLVLGSPIDKKAGIAESMFLPDYLMKGIDSSVRSKYHKVLGEKILINRGTAQPEPFRDTPLLLFSVIAVIVGVLSLLKNKTAVQLSRVFDFVLFLSTGLIGCLLLFMWLGTDHSACAANYNLLWAMPLNVLAAFAVWKRPGWFRKYMSVYAGLLLVTILVWFWLPQELNTGFLPIILLLLARCVQLRKG
ncbi:MAG: DUF4105 domain-containing protein [Chitinophagaceae bacterium]|nr:DUF4105 domain-containing protein [Chitinophagaceae bacterium]MCA6454400.1 DUF4105 domain-containing protein [Chitinophagaceae bacterium]MCA6455861.1 DUF4105 domain-containing protein [Chitinophagaceae bacterium]MCA6458209.1 DUF4105 domain-containing protein [Chitinophagaceae bacterium]MCA6463921.1 DUF4105 domain-containing protein [Chitinophagaceae bacterium]